MEILQSFGIQPLLLAAQIVNFLVLLFILKRFLYKPILKVLADRKEKIAESLKNAEEIEKRLLQIGIDREKKLKEASLEATKMLEDATKTGDQIIKESHNKAALDIKKLVEKAETQMKQDREKMNQEVKQHLADLLVLSFEKLADKVLSEKDQKEMIRKSIEEIKYD
ncbi:F0F1 ATP synthase subunit B [Candidatus Daviesbacteria bacterium]|nr:F0F1 ATP synthase subunit B [Candidatus Daviesbacteria bacterium]